MNEERINEDGNLVINPLEILAMQQDLRNIIEINELLETNLKEQVAGYKDAFAKLWEEVGTAALTGNPSAVIEVLNRSMVFYDLVVGRKA